MQEIEQVVSHCVGMELRWPNMNKIPYIRNVVEHGNEYYCNHDNLWSFRTFAGLSQALSVDLDYHHNGDEW